ncbi:MAG: efflux RND transporter periplasmic adaptor subunit [Bacteroidia bacterium]
MKRLFYLLFSLLLLSGCHPKQGAESEEDAAIAAITPVTTDSMQKGPLSEYLELNGVSSFLKKNSVKTAVSGYIRTVNVTLGDEVRKDQDLFTLKTKEASALDNFATKDSLTGISGLIHIRSFQDGIISTFNRHAGDFVQEGDELCILSDKSSFVFLLDVPFELHSMIHPGRPVEILLPNKEVIAGMIRSSLPSMDVNSQTESFIVQPSRPVSLPENLIARIRILKNKKEDACTLPRSAILSNEAQTEFWVMKLLNDSTAVRINVRKGIETTERTEITEPVFKANDRFITSGNYGLTDTAKVVLKTQ